MAKNMEVALLYDFYGEMLTDKQRDMVEQYYQNDLSLSEIAENAGISRQGVRDSIKRAELQLFEMEEKLGLAAKNKDIRASLEAIGKYGEAIHEHAAAIQAKEIEDYVCHLLLLTEKLKETLI